MQQSSEFVKPCSPPPTLIVSPNVQVHTRFDGSAQSSRVIHVTNYNHGPGIPMDSFPEDSSDSYFDTDTEDIPITEESLPSFEDSSPTLISVLKKAIASQNKNTDENYNFVNDNPKPINTILVHDELKSLMKEVDFESNVVNEDCIDILREEVPTIEIVEEPEISYRARYESEGCKGPIHGASETGFPTIKIVGYVGEVVITVYVVTRDNEPHLHAATGPGSSKAPCNEVKLANGAHAIQMVMRPTDENDEMLAVFDQLSIRRVRNWEADRELRARGVDPVSWKSKKKEAKLAFQANIPASKQHPRYLLTAYSRSFLCTAPSGNPEIWWTSLCESAPEGGNEIGFIGKKFASGFKIRFFSKEDDGQTWEAFADVDKNKSNLNACVAKVPSYKDCPLVSDVTVNVEIRVGPDKDPRVSDPIVFTYLATPTPKSQCGNCDQIKNVLLRVFNHSELKKESEAKMTSSTLLDNTQLFSSDRRSVNPLASNNISPVMNTLSSPNKTETQSSIAVDLNGLLQCSNSLTDAPLDLSSPCMSNIASNVNFPQDQMLAINAQEVDVSANHYYSLPRVAVNTNNLSQQQVYLPKGCFQNKPLLFPASQAKTSPLLNPILINKFAEKEQQRTPYQVIDSQTLVKMSISPLGSTLTQPSVQYSQSAGHYKRNLEREIDMLSDHVEELRKKLKLKQSFENFELDAGQNLPKTFYNVQTTAPNTSYVAVQPTIIPTQVQPNNGMQNNTVTFPINSSMFSPSLNQFPSSPVAEQTKAMEGVLQSHQQGNNSFQPFPKQLQEQMVSYKRDLVQDLSHQCGISSYEPQDRFNVEWERRSINDAIATNKVGFYGKNAVEEVDSDVRGFLGSMQHMSSTSAPFSTPPLTPSSQKNIVCMPVLNTFEKAQQLTGIGQEFNNPSAFSQASVDYSDAFANRAVSSNCEEWKSNLNM